MDKGKLSSAKHAKSQNPAVAYLRRMPMWQRVVSAVMAVLLAFLLWPADAAKTFRAWADAVAEATAEQQAAIVEDDAGGTEADAATDADVGGEEASEAAGTDEETIETSKDANEEADSSVPHEDGEIFAIDRSQLPNDINEAYDNVWDFSAYPSSVVMSKVTNKTAANSLAYADKNKIADLVFYGPLANSSNANYKLDGGDSTISAAKGWVMHNSHKLYGNTTVNVSNFIEFTPKVNLTKLVINCASIKYNSPGLFSSSKYAVIGICDVDNPTYSKAIKEENMKRTTLGDVTFSYNFQAGHKYYIYSRPDSTDHTDYGGMQIAKITATKAPATVIGNLIAPLNDRITFKIENSSKTYSTEITREAVAGEIIQNVKFENMECDDTATITATSHNTGRSVSYTFTLAAGDNTIDNDELNLAALYMSISGQFTNAGPTAQTFKLIYGDKEQSLGEVAANTTVDFTLEGVAAGNMLRVENANESISDYDEIYIPEDVTTSITDVQLTIDPTEQNSLYLVNTPYDEGNYIDEIVHQKIYYMCQIYGKAGEYTKSYIEPIKFKDEKGRWVFEYPAKVGTNLRIFSDPNGIYLLAPDADGNLQKVKVEGYELTASTVKGKAVVPTYKWDKITTNGPTAYAWQCKAEYREYNEADPTKPEQGRYHTQTITTEEKTSAGYITREITKRSTTEETGLEDLTAIFTADDEYFYPPVVKKDSEVPKDSSHPQTHYIEALNRDINFNTAWDNSTSLPTATGNYYLTTDITLSASQTISNSMAIDLNGHQIKIDFNSSSSSKAAIVNESEELILFDCCKGEQAAKHEFYNPGDTKTWTLPDATHHANEVYYGGVVTGAHQSAIHNKKNTLVCENVGFVGNENTYKGGTFGSGSGGGAIRSGEYRNETDLKLENCDFLGNTAKSVGGAVLIGVSNDTCGKKDGDTTGSVNNCYFANNSMIGESSSSSGNLPFGGGAFGTYSTNKNPVIDIHDSEFAYNTSNFRGGGILLFHGTTCHMWDVNIHDNRSGLKHELVDDDDVCYNYGGGVNLYTGTSANSNQAFLYLSGHCVIRHNYSRELVKGVEKISEDNLALQKQGAKGYVRFEKNRDTNSFPALDSDSFVGINYAKNYNIDCTIGYAEGILSGEDLSDPSVKNFYLDDVVNRYKYALLIQMGKGSKGSNATYELWIVDHKHDFKYTTSSSRNNKVNDILTVTCAAESGSTAHKIDGTKYYFSDCMYAADSLELKIHSRDGGDNGTPIEYEAGVEHPCVIDNSDEFEEYAGGKYAGEMTYYKKVDNGHGEIKWEKIDGAPIDPGTYKAEQKFYGSKVENDQIVVVYDPVYTIVSNEYEIAGTSLQIEILTSAEKDYDGSTAVQISGARLKGRIGAEEEVELSSTDGFNAYAKDPYVCGKDESGEYIAKELVGFDTQAVTLVGKDAWKYHLTGISGTVIIKPINQDITYEPLQLWPKPDSGDAEPYDLVDKMRNLQGSPQVVFMDGDGDWKFGDYATINPKDTEHIIQVTADAQTIAKDGEVLDEDSGLIGFYKRAYVKSIAAADINGDGIPEYNAYNRSTEAPSEDDPYIPLTFLSGMYDQTEIHFDVGYYDTNRNWVPYSDAGDVLLGNNAITSAKIVKSKKLSEISHEAGASSIKFYDVAQQTRTFNIAPKDAQRWVFAQIEDPDGNVWTKDEAGSYNWNDAESIDYNYHFRIVFNKLNFPEITFSLKANPAPEDGLLDTNNKVTYTVSVKNTGNVDFYKTKINSSLLKPVPWEEFELAIDEEKDLSTEYTVTEANVIAGSFTNNIYIEAMYGSDLRYETSDVALTHQTVPVRYVNPTMTLTANPATTEEVKYGDEIEYFAYITNNSNVSLTGCLLSDSLVGAVNQLSIKVGTDQVIAPGATVGPITITDGSLVPKYKVENVPISGNILNTANFVGYVEQNGVLTPYTCEASIEHHMGYTSIATPKPFANPLIYNGKDQFGIDFGASADMIEVLAAPTGRDVGEYTVVCKPKPWYKWSDAGAGKELATLEIPFTIQPKDLTVYYQEKTGYYSGQQLVFEWKDDTLSTIIEGFVPGGDGYEAEGAESVTLTTNGVNAGTYTGLGNGASQNRLVINTKENTKLSNYNITYKASGEVTDFKVVINKRPLDDGQWITAASTQDYVFDGVEKTAAVSVTLVDPVTGFTLDLQQGEGKDWIFDASSNYKATNASMPASETEDPGYTAKIQAVESSNFSGSVDVKWKISRRTVSFNIPANNLTTTYNAQNQTIDGYLSENITCSDPSFTTWESSFIKTDKTVSITGKNAGTYKLWDQEGLTDSFYYKDTDEANVKNVNASFTFTGGILTIVPRSIDTDCTITEMVRTYNGESQGPNLIVKLGEDITLGASDYTIEGQTSGINAGPYSIIVKGTGNFTGSKAFVWHIVPLDVYLDNGITSTKVYDDTVFTKTVEKTIADGKGKVTYTLTTSGVDAGVYGGDVATNTVSVNSTLTEGLASNYTIHNTVKSEETAPVLTISKRPIKVNSLEQQEFPYDAQVHSLDISYINFAEPAVDEGLLAQHKYGIVLWDGPSSIDHVDEPIEAKPLAIQILNANTGVEVADNYELTGLDDVVNKAKITITARDIYIEVTGNSATYTYDGQEHVVSGYTVKESTDGCYDPPTGLLDPSNVFPLTDEISTGNQKYVKLNDEGEVETYELLYNGSPVTKDIFNYDDANFNPTFIFNEPGGLTINKRALKFSVADGAKEDTETHNPLAHTVDARYSSSPDVSGLADGDGVLAVFTTNDYKAKSTPYTYENGEIDTNITFNDDVGLDRVIRNSYDISYDVALTIASNIVINIKAKKHTTQFNGHLQTLENFWDESGSTPETRTDLEVTCPSSTFNLNYLHCTAPGKLSTSGTNAGTYYYPISARDFYYLDPGNDDAPAITVDAGVLEITPFDLANAQVIGWKETPATYDAKLQEPTEFGISQSITIPAEAGVEPYVIWLNDVNAEQYAETNVGNYTLTLTPRSGNFTGTFTKDWSIAKASIIISLKGNTATKNYNGYDQYVNGYEVTGARPFYFDDSKIKPVKSDVRASGTNVGTYYMGLSASDFSYEDSDNVDVTFDVTDGWLEIEKAELTDLIEIIPGETSFTYDGTLKTTIPKAVWKSTGNEFGITNFTVEGNTGTAVPRFPYECSISWSGLDNFKDSETPVTYQWNINQAIANVDIVGKTKVLDYNGQQQPSSGYRDFDAIETTNTGLFDSTKVICRNRGVQATNAGTYYANFVSEQFDYNSNAPSDTPDVKVIFNIRTDACLIINPIDLSNATWDIGNQNRIYNFEDQGPSYEGMYGATQLLEGQDFYVTGQKAQNIGDYTLTIKGVDGGNFKGTLTYPWKISKLPIGVKVIPNSNKSVAFDGSTQYIKGYNKLEKEDDVQEADFLRIKDHVSPGPNDVVVSGVDVGEYSMNLMRTKFECDNPNIDFSYTVTGETTLTITENNWNNFTASATNLIYNGKEQKTSISLTDGHITLTEGVDFEVLPGVPVDWTGNKGTLVGEYTATIKPIGNFTGENKDVEWFINKATLNIQVNGESRTTSYNSNEQTAQGFSINSDSSLYDPKKAHWNKAYENVAKISGTNAGTYTYKIVLEGEEGQAVNFSYDDIENFNINVTATDVTLIINKKDATLSVNADKLYDESSPSVLTAGFTKENFVGLEGEDDLYGSVKTNSVVPATYNVEDSTSVSGFTAKYDDACKALLDNYKISYNVELTIKSAENIILVRGNTVNKVYNGTEQKATGFTYSKPTSFTGTVETIDGSEPEAKGTDAGIYYMNWTAEDFKIVGEGADNYEIQYIDGYINIDKKNINDCEITVEPREFVYSSTEQGPRVTVKDNGVVVNSSNYVLTDGSSVDAGNFNLMIGGVKNYTGTVDNGYLWSIRKADAVVNIDVDLEYMNNYISYTFSNDDVKGVMINDDLSGTFTTRGMEIGTYTYDPLNVTPTGIDLTNLSENTKNYNLSYNVRINIIKHVLNIDPGERVGENAFTYNGMKQYILESDVKYYGSDGPESLGVLPGHAVTILDFSNNYQINVGTNSKVQVGSVTIKDAKGADVADKYLVNYIMGKIEVKPAHMKLKITGKQGKFPYDGKAHTVLGYDAYEVPATETGQITGLFDLSKLTTSKLLTATETNPKKAPTYMGGLATDFTYNDSNIQCSAADGDIDYEDGYVQVVAADWDSVQISTTNVTYNGLEQNANLKVMSGNQYLVEGTDYTIEQTEKAKLTRTDADKVTFTIKAAGKYKVEDEELTKEGTWEVYKANMTISVSGNSATYYYDKQEHKVEGATYTEIMSGSSYTGLFDKTKVKYQGSDTAPVLKATEPGTYNKGLDSKDFAYDEGDNINATFVIAKDMQLSINKPNIGEPNFNASAGDPLTYNGALQSPTITVTQTVQTTEEPVVVYLVLGKDFKIVDFEPQSDVGKYYVTVEGIGNYYGVRQNVEWQIAPKTFDVYVGGSSKNVQYNGQYQKYDATLSSVSFKGPREEDLDAMFDANKVIFANNAYIGGVDAGTYELTLDASMFSYADKNVVPTFNMLPASCWLALTISPKALRITAIEAKMKDETSLTHNISQDEVVGAVAGQVVTGTAVSYKWDTDENKYVPSADVGTYQGDPDPETHKPKVVEFNVAVDGKKVDVEPANGDTSNYYLDNESLLRIVGAEEEQFIDIYGATVTKEYNGTEQSIGLTEDNVLDYITCTTNVPDFDKSQLTITGWTDPSSTDAGTFDWGSVTVEGPSGATITVQRPVQLEITKRDINKAATSIAEGKSLFEYNREIQAPTNDDIHVAEHVGQPPRRAIDYSIDIPESTNPGNYNVTITAKDGGNYEGSVTLMYTITKAKRIVKVIGLNYNAAYTGYEISTKDLVPPEVSYAGYVFHECDSQEIPLETGKLFSDDGSMFNPKPGDIYTTGTVVGTYNMGIDISKFQYDNTDASNIEVGFKLVSDGSLNISKGQLGVKFTDPSENPGTYTYDGKQHSAEFEVYWVVDPRDESTWIKLDNTDYTVSGTTTATNASSDEGYQFTVTGVGDYAGFEPTTATWKIEKATRTIKLSGHTATRTYNGSLQTVVGYDAEEVVPEGEEEIIDKTKIDSSLTSTSVAGKDVKRDSETKEVIKYPMNLNPQRFRYEDMQNVTCTFVFAKDESGNDLDGWLLINPCALEDVVKTLVPESFVYDSNPHHPVLTLTNGTETLQAYVDASTPFDYKVEGLGDQTNIGSYNYTITIPEGSKGNYIIREGEEITGTWSIVPATMDIYITGYNNESAEIEYDGQSHTVGGTEDMKFTAESDSALFDPDKVYWKYEEGQPAKYPEVSSSEVGLKYMGLIADDFTYLQDPSVAEPIVVKFHIKQDGWIRIKTKSIDQSSDLMPIEKPEYDFRNSDYEAEFHIELANGTVLYQGTDYMVYDNVAMNANKEQTEKTSEDYYYKDSKIEFIGNYSGWLTNDDPNFDNDHKLYFHIKKANLEMKATGKYESFDYDGQEHMAAGYTLEETTTTGLTYLVDQNKVEPTIGDVFVTGKNKGYYYAELPKNEPAPGEQGWTYKGDDTNLNVKITTNTTVTEEREHPERVELTITGKDINDSSIEVIIPELTYNGETQFPEVRVIDTTYGELGEWDITIIENPQKDVNVDPETKEILGYEFTIEGFKDKDGHTGNYTGTRTEVFKILPKEVNYKYTDEKVYDGKPYEITSRTITKDDFPELCGTDSYVINAATMNKKSEQTPEISPNAAFYPYKESVVNGSYFNLKATAVTDEEEHQHTDTNYVFNISEETEITIAPYQITSDDSCRVKFKQENIEYDGKVHAPKYKLYDTFGSEVESEWYDLQAAVDYNSTYVPKKHVNYTNPDNPDEDEHYTVDFEAKGNYTGAWGSEWFITPRPITGEVLVEINDPRDTGFTGLNKEYDGKPCVIGGTADPYIIGNRTGDIHKPTNMIAGDFVNTEWTTVGVNAGLYTMTNGGTTEITLKAIDAENSPCYARDYEYKLDARIKIFQRTIDPTEPDFDKTFAFSYNWPVYNGTPQMLHDATGPSDPKDLGAAVIYDDGIDQWLRAEDFYMVGDSHKHVRIDGDATYDAAIHGEGNYRDAKDLVKPWTITWDMKPYTIPAYYYEDLTSFTYLDKQYDKSVDLPEMVGTQRITFPGDHFTLEWKTWAGAASQGIIGKNAGDYYRPYPSGATDEIGELTFDNVTADAHTSADYTYNANNITGRVRINKRAFDPDLIKFTINPLTYNGSNQHPLASDITAIDYNIEGGKTMIFGTDFQYYGTPTDQRNVPETGKYSIQFEGINNYAGFTSDPIEWTINPRPFTFTSDDTSTYTYDGNKKTGTWNVVSELVGGDKITVTWETDSADAGEYKLNWDSKNANKINVTNEAPGTATTYLRNYLPRTYKAHLVIGRKSIADPSVQMVTGSLEEPTYTGGPVAPKFKLMDNDTGKELTANDFIITVQGADQAVDVRTDEARYLAYAEGLEGGNYTGQSAAIDWNVRPKQVDIVVDDTKVYDGEVFASHFKLETGTVRVDEGNTPEEVYINSETDSAEIGTYVYEPEANDRQVIFDPAEGIEAGFEWMKLTNFDFETVDPEITLHITEAPVPPEPTPPEPEYIDADTGDMPGIIIIGLLASAVVCAFVMLRRKKSLSNDRWNA